MPRDRHPHPTQIAAWKREAVEKLAKVFDEKGSAREQNRDAELTKLHAKIGVYLNAFETGSEARTGIGRWIGYYNADRPHSVFAGKTPDEVYATQATEERLAA